MLWGQPGGRAFPNGAHVKSTLRGPALAAPGGALMLLTAASPAVQRLREPMPSSQDASQSKLESPLSGLRVLDFSRVLAGPFAGRMLCDLGADVVKVEPPDGDNTRLWGRQIAGLSGYYVYANAGKRNISIDLRAEGARDLVLRLAAKADIVIENFRPDVMDRLGIGYGALSAVNPGIIMLSISGFGRAGPESHKPAYAPIVHAELGLLSRSARRFGQAQDLPLSVADTNAGLHGLVAVLAAVILRSRTGRGQHIDLAMLDATVVADDALHYELDAAEDVQPLAPDIWTTGAGDVLISADFRYLWRLLCETYQIPDPTLPEHDLAAKIAARRAAASAFMRSLTSWDAVEAAMAKMNLAWGRLRAGADLPDQPTLRARGSFAAVDDRAGGARLVAQSPYRFSAAAAGIRGPGAYRGEHNAEVLADWLGDAGDMAAGLAQSGVFSAAAHDKSADR